MLCNETICGQCLKILPASSENEADTPVHVCNEEDQQTVALLKTNTRSCPSCRTSIYKISGCDQMWCVQCHTAFSWSTGNIMNQTIHNPHYYEWLRRSGNRNGDPPREIMDIPCGGMPTAVQVRQYFPQTHHEWAFHLHQTVAHLENHTIPRYTHTCTVQESRKELRVMYLCKQISKDDWRNELYHREKNVQKYRRYVQILQTFVTVVSDWFRQSIIMLNTGTLNDQKDPSLESRSARHDHLEIRMIELSEFLQYMNGQIGHLNRQFKSNLATIPFPTHA